MTIQDMISEIKTDLGSDVNSLGISDSTIEKKISESLRKISSYAPYVSIDTIDVTNGYVVLPDTTTTVLEVFKTTSTASQVSIGDDQDLFSVQKYMYTNSNSYNDPYIFLMQKSNLRTLQNFVTLEDWYYNRQDHKLLLSNLDETSVTVKYMRAYTSIEEVSDELVLQKIKEYALALCKIVEGLIRRKLQSAPGSIQMDGDSLVSEGTNEKSSLDQSLPTIFKYLRFGLRA